LDLKRPNVNFIFEDIKNLSKKALQLFQTKTYFSQNIKLLLKLLQYQIYNEANVSIFGDFKLETFISSTLLMDEKE
jgi:hypothetical protein